MPIVCLKKSKKITVPKLHLVVSNCSVGLSQNKLKCYFCNHKKFKYLAAAARNDKDVMWMGLSLMNAYFWVPSPRIVLLYLLTCTLNDNVDLHAFSRCCLIVFFALYFCVKCCLFFLLCFKKKKNYLAMLPLHGEKPFLKSTIHPK